MGWSQERLWLAQFSVGATQNRKAPGQIFVSMIAPGNQADGSSREKGTEEYFFTAIV